MSVLSPSESRPRGERLRQIGAEAFADRHARTPPMYDPWGVRQWLLGYDAAKAGGAL